MTLKRDLRVAYLGPAASFSHQATIQAFSPCSQVNLHPLPSFDAILAGIQNSSGQHENEVLTNAVLDSDFDFAVLPVENSTNGGVVPVLDLLTHCDRDSNPCLYPDIEVVGEQYLEVHHNFFVHPSIISESTLDAVPGNGHDHTTDFQGPPLYQKLNIRTLYTHPQVWGQCDRFLSFHFPPSEVERRNMSSTSAAAAYVAQHSTITMGTNPEGPLPTPQASQEGAIAAISSSLAGSQNHLVCLASNIEDEPGKNTTRFLIIRNKHRPLPPSGTVHQMPWLTPSSSAQNTFYKSLITFTNMHDSTPGALATALAIFQKHNFNLTAITTRPSRERPWHYVFFVECEQERSPGQDDSRVKTLFAELSGVTQRSTLLGSWINRLKHTSGQISLGPN